MCIIDSPCYAAETNTTLVTSYIPIKINLKKRSPSEILLALPRGGDFTRKVSLFWSLAQTSYM